MQKSLKRALMATLALITPAAFAICPLCTVAVGAGIGLSEYLGIDDVITGLWIGAIVVSFSFWTSSWINQKGWRFPLQGLVILIAYYLIVVLPLWYPMHYIGRPGNLLWEIDKILLGVIIGSIVFFFGSIFHFYLKAQHENRVYFPFQKVVIPIAPIIIISIIFYFVTK